MVCEEMGVVGLREESIPQEGQSQGGSMDEVFYQQVCHTLHISAVRLAGPLWLWRGTLTVQEQGRKI